MATANQSRPPISAETKRQVRQRCGFGCIFCGLPIYDYDHVVEWALVREHDPENLVLLCPTHHASKRGGILDHDAIRQRATQPANLSRDRTQGLPLEISARGIDFKIGSNVFTNDLASLASGFSAVHATGTDFLSARAEDGWLVLDLLVTSPWGRPLLMIEAGELSVRTDVWDYEKVGSRFTVRSAPRSISVEVSIQGGTLHLRHGFFAKPDFRLQITPDEVIVGPDLFMPPMAEPLRGRKTILSGTHVRNSRYGIFVGS